MGAEKSKLDSQQTVLKVANLNFSGQQSSPFEYFSREHLLEQQELNRIFSEVLKITEGLDKKQIFSEDVMKKISQIDKVIKSDRYSPLYNPNCGIIDGKFATKEQFKSQWTKTIKATAGWMKLKKKNQGSKIPEEKQVQPDNKKKEAQPQSRPTPKKPTPSPQQAQKQQAQKQKSQQKQKDIVQFYSQNEMQRCLNKDYKEQLDRLRAFDYLIYAAILRYVYQHSDLENIIKDRACNKYRGFMEEFFSKIYLNTNKKIIQAIDFVLRNDIDVLFVQEATEKLCTEFEKRDPDFRIIMSKEKPNDPGLSVVILRESSFKKSNIGRKGNLKLLQITHDKKLKDEAKKNFLSWGKCAFISIDNFILISCHSKTFTSQMQNDLKIIHEKFPGKYVIVGGTLTKGCKRYDSDKTKGQYDMYPSRLATCYKKRTYMQFQRKKAGSLIKTQTNFILYDKRLNLPNDNDYQNDHEDIYKGIFTIQNTLVQIQAVDDDKKDPITKPQILDKKSKEDTINIQLLPSEEHPFDQLIVLTTLKIPRRIDKNDREGNRKLTKEEKQRLQFETSSSQEEDTAEGYFGMRD